MDINQIIAQAQTLIKQGNYAQAINHIDKYLPDVRMPRVHEGKPCYQFPTDLDNFAYYVLAKNSNILSVQHAEYILLKLKARALQKLKQHASALNVYSEILEISPVNNEILVSLNEMVYFVHGDKVGREKLFQTLPFIWDSRCLIMLFMHQILELVKAKEFQGAYNVAIWLKRFAYNKADGFMQNAIEFISPFCNIKKLKVLKDKELIAYFEANKLAYMPAPHCVTLADNMYAYVFDNRQKYGKDAVEAARVNCINMHMGDVKPSKEIEKKYSK